jgi:hypothetical protein
MEEDAPPSDINGTDENPDAPRAVGGEAVKVVAPKPTKKKPYPIEDVLRPITLPQNLSEVAIDPHADVHPYYGSSALYARYGITDKIQIRLTYLWAGVYGTPNASGSDSATFHPGKAVGLDATYMLQDWIGVQLGVPVYLDPVAVSLAIGAPIKFTFGDKYAIGGLDDLLNIKLDRFAPSFMNEFQNAVGVFNDTNTTEQSRGHLRFSFYGEYQYAPNLAFIGRVGVDDDLGSGGGSSAGTTMGSGGTVTFLRAGLQYSPRPFLDVGGSLGFDDLGTWGTFDPEFYLALRI